MDLKKLDISKVTATISLISLLFGYISTIKTDIILAKKDIQDLKESLSTVKDKKLLEIYAKIENESKNVTTNVNLRIDSVNKRIDEISLHFSGDLSDYKVRNNKKVDDMNEKQFETHAKVIANQQMTKINQDYINTLVKLQLKAN